MSKYFTDWAIEDEAQALKVLNRMLRSASGMRVGKEEGIAEIRAAVAEAMKLHPQSDAIRTFAEEL